MRLPTRNEVDTASRYAGTIAATAVAIFGLQAKGISLDQVKAVIAAMGDFVNTLLVLISTITPVYLAVKGIMSSSPSGQAALIGANASTIVNAVPGGKATVTINDPDMAKAALEAQKNAA